MLLLASRMAEAYFEDPVQVWLFADVDRRLNRLRRFYERDLRARLLERAVGMTTQEGAGCAFWLPPGQWVVSWSARLRIAPSFASLLGRRALDAYQGFSQINRRHPPEPHWYLSHLAVAPPHQGRGIATTLMNAGLRVADQDGLPVYLESSSASNVLFYRRFGFASLEAIELPNGPPLFPMLRPSRRDST